MANHFPDSSSEHRLGSGNFFGAVRGRVIHSGAIFTDLRHAIPRQLPNHSHELPFFGLLLDGQYGERYGRQHKQFRPFSIMFRPAGVPHQDEIGPAGLRFFHFELRAGWKNRIAECSGNLDLAYEDTRGGRLIWLALKLMRETIGCAQPDALCVESLLAEAVALAARLPLEEKLHPPKWLSRVLDKLHIEHCRLLTLDELSREAQVHPVHLSRVFRRFQGEGIGEYVHRLRARTACTRLLNPELPLAEISLETGFSDQSHFTRAFRKITGMTPQAFRDSIRPPGSSLETQRHRPKPVLQEFCG
jgi:AraC family transcriptional regulator